MRKLKTAVLAIILTFLLTPAVQADTLDDVKFYVDTYYYGTIPTNLDSMTTIEQIINSLDAHSIYLTKKEYDQYLKMIGEEIKSANAVAAEEPPESHITSAYLYNNTGYIKITNFSADLGQAVESHWKSLKTKGATSLILDLRNNGGGYVDSAEELIGFFEGAQNAYYLLTREPDKMKKAVPTKTKFPKETYILINRLSASASEMVAISVKDQKAATIIGEKSRGKGTIQTIFPELTGGGALKLTTGEFKGPNGTTVNKTGVTPHIEITPGTELAEAHRSIIEKSLKNQYIKKINSIQTIEPNKSFRIKLPYKMNFQGVQTSNRIELVQLGGGAPIPVTISQGPDDQTLDITPQQQLEPGTEYTLIIRPETKRLNGKPTKTGKYTNITVRTSTTATK